MGKDDDPPRVPARGARQVATSKGKCTVNSKPFHVWLVEHNDPFMGLAAAKQKTLRKELLDLLQKWFQQVVRHDNAKANVPSGFCLDARVEWSDVSDASKIVDTDLIIYFS